MLVGSITGDRNHCLSLHSACCGSGCCFYRRHSKSYAVLFEGHVGRGHRDSRLQQDPRTAGPAGLPPTRARHRAAGSCCSAGAQLARITQDRNVRAQGSNQQTSENMQPALFCREHSSSLQQLCWVQHQPRESRWDRRWHHTAHQARLRGRWQSSTTGTDPATTSRCPCQDLPSHHGTCPCSHVAAASTSGTGQGGSLRHRAGTTPQPSAGITHRATHASGPCRTSAWHPAGSRILPIHLVIYRRAAWLPGRRLQANQDTLPEIKPHLHPELSSTIYSLSRTCPKHKQKAAQKEKLTQQTFYPTNPCFSIQTLFVPDLLNRTTMLWKRDYECISKDVRGNTCQKF